VVRCIGCRPIKCRKIEGFICDAIITLEGIKVDDRAAVFGSTALNSGIVPDEDNSTIHINMKVEQPLRKAIHPKQAERFSAALEFGLKLIGAPRTGMPRVEVPGGNPYVEESEAALSLRLDRYFEIAEAIKERGFGTTQAKLLAQRFADRGGQQIPWFKALGAAKDVHEVREVARAVAEWADADSIAAHYGYGNDLFCTRDEGVSAGESILDSGNRAWLLQTFGIQFVTPSEITTRL
jgi:hypothetical protein